jgi:hypothetical protein
MFQFFKVYRSEAWQGDRSPVARFKQSNRPARIAPSLSRSF